jgi:hypothetical protein
MQKYKVVNFSIALSRKISLNHANGVRDVFTAVNMWIVVFWVVTLFSLVFPKI